MSKRKGNGGAGSSQGQIIQIDEAQIKGHLDEMVRGTVEEMLNVCWMPRQNSLLEPAGTSGAQGGRIPGPGITRGV
jgi:hypothetical protein